MSLEQVLIQEVLDFSREHKLSHISSNTSILPILIEIYSQKKFDDIIQLTNAHSHVAHLIVREAFKDLPVGETAESIWEKTHDIHCSRQAGCDASGGSLTHSGISLGYAISNRKRTVHMIISDGSACEGSLAETLRIAFELQLENLKIYANFNGYSATQEIDTSYFMRWISGFGFPIRFYLTKNAKGYEGVSGHYCLYEKGVL